MDAFLRTLQDVADLPNQAANQGRGNGDAGASGAGDDDVDSMTREELVQALREAVRRATAAEEKAESLRAEATDINDQFGAFKVKVNTWREQIKQARAQDRKTIEALRAAAAASASSDADGAGGEGGSAGVDKSYVTSLEEQVHALKETVRRHAAERDGLQLELDKVKARARAELQDAIDAAAKAKRDDADEHDGDGAGRQSETRAASEAHERRREGSVADGGDSATVAKLRSKVEELQAANRRYAALVSQLEDDATAQKAKLDGQERANEVLTQELDQANNALTKAVADHAEQLKVARSEAQRTTSAQYAKDLEQELAQYRRRLHEVQEQLADAHGQLAVATAAAGSNNAASSTGASAGTSAAVSPTTSAAAKDGDNGDAKPASPAAAMPPTSMPPAVADYALASVNRKLQGRVDELEREIAAKNQSIATLQGEVDRLSAAQAELEAESEMREETLNSVFSENKVLRERVEALREELDAEARRVADVERSVQDREAAAEESHAKIDDLAKSLMALQKQHQKLQREHAEKADEARQLKLQELQRQTEEKMRQQRSQQERAQASGGVAAAGAAAAATSGVQAQTPDDVIAARLQAASLAAKYQRYLAAGKQVWSNARMRTYAIAAGVLMLMVLFIFHQGAAIEQDTTTIELLRRCKELTKAGVIPTGSAA